MRAEAKTQEVVQGFLKAARAAQARQLAGRGRVTAHPAVPMTIQRVSNIERAQILVESDSSLLATAKSLPKLRPGALP